jgi:hypothetical protein
MRYGFLCVFFWSDSDPAFTTEGSKSNLPIIQDDRTCLRLAGSDSVILFVGIGIPTSRTTPSFFWSELEPASRRQALTSRFTPPQFIPIYRKGSACRRQGWGAAFHIIKKSLIFVLERKLTSYKLIKIEMDIQTLYTLKPKFVAREVGNELILVPLTGNVAQMSELFTLNETGRFIWENSNETTTSEQMENLLTESFTIDNETAKKDLENFLVQMEKMMLKKG